MTENNSDKILLTRIDNRLVHGQVGVTWTNTLGAEVIVVTDDEVRNDMLQQRLMASIAKSSSVDIYFFSIEEFVQIILHKPAEKKIFLVVRTPLAALEIVRRGVALPLINIGNMHYSHGKKPITKKIYLDEQDAENLRELIDSGSTLFAQDVPGSIREELKEIHF